ncbi:zinc finger HIT domain-containing protein 3 [Ceratina calcarata]|uniref:Zinc finger HIT domain-containing protein 3 n=1 Tax=Ceratina calcarata TaxID=156304 RepID=A0AAJ7NAA4_9HYME|nr:zinc finger HIT domain-containing protein 3 [Ceratina calcarata]
MGKVCCVCGKEESSYKCPVCKEPYCSIDCCKSHKTKNCELSKPQEKNAIEDVKGAVKYDFPTEDTVPIEKLRQLRDSEDLKDCLKNPHVRNIMRGILADKNPTKAIASAMTEPIFVEMADACLKVVESQ